MPYYYVRNGRLIQSDKPPRGVNPYQFRPLEVGISAREVYESLMEDAVEDAVATS